MSYNVSYITNAEEQRHSDLEDTESEIETKSESSMVDLNDVKLISENLGDIPIKQLHDYILRKHEVMDEGFKAEFKVGKIVFINFFINFIFYWLLSNAFVKSPTLKTFVKIFMLRAHTMMFIFSVVCIEVHVTFHFP